VSLPLGNHLHVNAAFDCTCDEHPPKRALTERRKT
jgi:hypothetical protein